MAKLVDYSSNGVNERDIFVVGSADPGLGMAGILSDEAPTGRGLATASGPLEDEGMDGIFFEP